jgi:hypothetical protein
MTFNVVVNKGQYFIVSVWTHIDFIGNRDPAVL